MKLTLPMRVPRVKNRRFEDRCTKEGPGNREERMPHVQDHVPETGRMKRKTGLDGGCRLSRPRH